VQAAAPAAFVEHCRLAALLDAPSIARLGGATIYEREGQLHIERAWPEHIRRAWTVRTADQE
jgi:hypothetical protein